jgi:hypothetical protein
MENAIAIIFNRPPTWRKFIRQAMTDHVPE